jgi:hypothetical protein
VTVDVRGVLRLLDEGRDEEARARLDEGLEDGTIDDADTPVAERLALRIRSALNRDAVPIDRATSVQFGPGESDLADAIRALDHVAAAEGALRAGRVDELVDESLAADGIGPTSLPWLRFRVGSVLQACYRFSGDAAHRDRALATLARVADRIDVPRLAVPARGLMGNIHMMAGAFHAAVDRCDAGLALAAAAGLADEPAPAMAHQFRGYVLFEWNRVVEAEAELLRAWTLAGPRRRGVRSGVARTLAELRSSLGDRVGADLWLDRLHGTASRSGCGTP